MTIITLTESTLQIPNKFKTEKELFFFLLNKFEDKVLLQSIKKEDLTTQEQLAYQSFKQSSHQDFEDFQG